MVVVLDQGLDLGREVAGQEVVLQQDAVLQSHSKVYEVQRVGDFLGPHVGAQLSGDDVAREVVEHGQEVHPTPPDDLEEVKSVCHISFGCVVFGKHPAKAAAASF